MFDFYFIIIILFPILISLLLCSAGICPPFLQCVSALWSLDCTALLPHAWVWIHSSQIHSRPLLPKSHLILHSPLLQISHASLLRISAVLGPFLLLFFFHPFLVFISHSHQCAKSFSTVVFTLSLSLNLQEHRRPHPIF